MPGRNTGFAEVLDSRGQATSATVIAVTDWETVDLPQEVEVGYSTASGPVRGVVNVVDSSVQDEVQVGDRLDVVYDKAHPTVVRLAENLDAGVLWGRLIGVAAAAFIAMAGLALAVWDTIRTLERRGLGGGREPGWDPSTSTQPSSTDDFSPDGRAGVSRQTPPPAGRDGPWRTPQ